MAAAEQFRNRRWRGRRQVQESESVACTRKCHGYAVGGVDGAEALRGCTLRRACASVSKWRASELCRPRPKKNFAEEFSTKGGGTKLFTRQARQEKNWNPENEESTRRDGCAEKKKNICQTPFKGRVSRVLRYTLGAVSTARSAFGAVRSCRTAFTVLRCEETPFTLHAMNRARLAGSRGGLGGACAARAPLHAPRSQRGAQRR